MKKRAHIIILFSFLLCLWMAGTYAAAAKTAAPGYFRIFSVKDRSLALSVEGGFRENGATLELQEQADDGRDIFLLKKAKGSWFQIQSLLSGKAVSISGTNIEQNKWKSSKDQLWKFEAAGTKRFYIVSKSGKYMSIDGKGAEAGQNVAASEKSDSVSATSGKWVLVPVKDYLAVSAKSTAFSSKAGAARIDVNSSGKWKASCSASWIRLKKSGSALLISCSSNKGEDRTAVVTVKATASGKTAKIKVSQKSAEHSAGKKNVTPGTYYVISALGEDVFGLGVKDAKKANGTNVRLERLAALKEKQFKLKYIADGSYAVLAKHSGKCLEADGSTLNVQQWQYGGYNQQLWNLEDAGDGYYYIRSKESGKYLTVKGGKAENGVNVYVTKLKKKKSQKWKLADPKEFSAGYRYLWKSCGKADVTDAFLEKVLSISNDIGTDPDDLMAVMAFESSLNHTAVNPKSNATGLIQFLPSTAASLGTSTSALKAMSAVRQLDYVKSYLSRYSGRMKTIGSLYMAVLWPNAVGQADSYVLWRKGGVYHRQYSQNSGLDVNGDGTVTVGEAVQKVLACRKRFVGA